MKFAVRAEADPLKRSKHAPAPVPVEYDPQLVGYIRVSTDEQNDELQRYALVRAGVDPEQIYSDIGVSGAADVKPARALAMRHLRSGMTLVVWKLDRVSRDLLDLLTLLRGMEAEDIGLRSLQESIDTKSPMGKVMLAVLGAFAQFERDTGVQRTRAGVERALARGVRFGQPTKITPTVAEKVDAALANGERMPVIAKRLRLAESTLRKYWKGDRLAMARAGEKTT